MCLSIFSSNASIFASLSAQSQLQVVGAAVLVGGWVAAERAMISTPPTLVTRLPSGAITLPSSATLYCAEGAVDTVLGAEYTTEGCEVA